MQRGRAAGAPAAFLFTASLLNGSGRVVASDLARGTANAGAPHGAATIPELAPSRNTPP